jgi:hypothetical protein
MKGIFSFAVVLLSAGALYASTHLPTGITGNYLEVRSCDVYTGSCFANAEMGLAGKEGILVWSVQEGTWNGTSLKGLSVIAVLSAKGTLGDLKYQPQSAKAVLLVDAKASSEQREALKDFACSMSGKLIAEVVDTKSVNMEVALTTCNKAGCASVKAGDLVQVSTRCLGGNDHLCGNEVTYYPPLTKVEDARPAFTEVASFQGTGLDKTWRDVGHRSAFLASFAR